MTPFPFFHLIVNGIFFICIGLAAAGAFIAVSSPRIIRSVCGLIMCCIGVAGLYYFLHSPFLALMEILIYVGAVCVIIVLAVMLAEPGEPVPERDEGTITWWGVLALAVGGLVFFGVWRLATLEKGIQPARVNTDTLENVGASILTTYSMAFEVISLVLLVAILGALVVAWTGRRRS